MLPQWQEELESRFGLRFEILDREYVATVRRERGFGVNPWTTHPCLLVSHRLLIDDSYTATLRDWLGPLQPYTDGGKAHRPGQARKSQCVEPEHEQRRGGR